MILLDGQSLKTKNFFIPESMALNLEERNSTATITVGPDAPEIPLGAWLKDDTEPGSGIVWRVKTLSIQEETRTRTIQLEHIVQALKDRILFGDVTPAKMSGSKGAKNCTARQAIAYILKDQSVWALGDTCENPSNPYSFNGESLYAAIETVTGSIDGAQWEYDLTAVPFRLHLRRAPEGFQSEMRMSRNITTIRRQIDRTRMYTRHYPIGKNNLHIEGNYLSRNESLYGVICKVETDQSQDTKEKLQAWSLERLKRHCEPVVTVTVTGLDLSEDTGEPLDHIVVGRHCRVPLPEYGTTILEKVTKLAWGDKIKEPEKVTVIMANQLEDVASIISRMESSGGRSGRTGAKQAEEDHAWFEDTTEHVAMVAEAVAGEGAAQDWSRVSKVLVDGQGIHQRVTKAENDIVTQEARIDINEEQIGLVVGKYDDGGNFIRAAEITASINESTGKGEAKISADHVYIGNEKSTTVIAGKLDASAVTANYIKAKIELIDNVRVKRLTVGNGGTLSFEGGDGVTVTGSQAAGILRNIRITRNGDDYTLAVITCGDPDWQDVATFSRATSLSGEWSGRTYTVTASPQGDTIETALWNGLSKSGNPSYSYNSATGHHEISQSVSVYSADAQEHAATELLTKTVTMVADTAYTAGYNTGYDTGGATASVGGSNRVTVNGTYIYKAYYEDKTSHDDIETGHDLTVTVDVDTGTTLAGNWDGRTYTVTASPQGDTIVTALWNGLSKSGSPSYSYNSGTGHHEISQTVKVYSADAQEHADAELLAKTVTFTADAAYTAGYNTGYDTGGATASIGGPNTITANGVYTYKAYYEDKTTHDDIDTGHNFTVTVDLPITGTTLAGNWNGRTYTVTATPQGKQIETALWNGLSKSGNPSYAYNSGTGHHEVSQSVSVYSENSQGHADTVLLTKTVTLVADAAHTAGYNTGYDTGGATASIGGPNTITANGVYTYHAYYTDRVSGDDVDAGHDFTVTVDLPVSGTTLDGSWSGRTFTVTATPQGNTKAGIVYDGLMAHGTITYTQSGNNHYVKQNVTIYAEDEHGDAGSTIMDKPVTILANQVYTAGHTAGYNTGYDTGGATGSVGGPNSITSNGTYTYKGYYEDRVSGNDIETGHNLSVTVNVDTGTTLSGNWNGRTYTVTASPQGDQIATSLWNGLSKSGNPSYVYNITSGHHEISQTVKVYSADAQGHADAELLAKTVTLTADAAYTAGYNTGYDTGGATASVGGPNSITSNGTYTYKGYYEDRVSGDDIETGHNLSVTVKIKPVLTGKWSGRNFTVTSSPAGNSATGTVYTTLVNTGSVTYTVNGSNHYVKQSVIVYTEDENGDAGKKIMERTVSILANKAYSAGETVGRNTGYDTGGRTASVGGPNSITSNGTYTYKAYYEDRVSGDDIETGNNLTVTVNVYPNSMSMTRVPAGRNSAGQTIWYGMLYYWDDDDGSYTRAYSGGNRYWYVSTANRSGTTTVHY